MAERKRKRKLTAKQKAEKRRRRREYKTIFINGKQKRVKREEPQTIDGIDVDEWILRNADPIWLHQNEMRKYIETVPDGYDDPWSKDVPDENARNNERFGL